MFRLLEGVEEVTEMTAIENGIITATSTTHTVIEAMKAHRKWLKGLGLSDIGPVMQTGSASDIAFVEHVSAMIDVGASQ